jgi:hypothetical protein
VPLLLLVVLVLLLLHRRLHCQDVRQLPGAE